MWKLMHDKNLLNAETFSLNKKTNNIALKIQIAKLCASALLVKENMVHDISLWSS